VVGKHNLGTLLQQDGTATVQQDMTLGSGSPGGEGTYEMQGGLLTVGADVRVGYSGTGRLDQGGGRVEVAGNLTVCHQPGGQGRYQMAGGILDVEGDVRVSLSGTGHFDQMGGTVDVLGDLVLGQYAAGTGTYETLVGTALTVRSDLTVGQAGTGTFTQKGGIVHVLGDLVIGENSDSMGTYQLDAGSLQVDGMLRIGVDGVGRFWDVGGEYTARRMHIGPFGSIDVPDRLLIEEEFRLEGADVELDARDLVLDGDDGIGFMGTDSHLRSKTQSYGDARRGVMTQQGGTNTLTGTLYLGRTATGYGEYRLAAPDAVLESQDVVVGSEGAGVMYQDGGTNSILGTLILGQQSGSRGGLVKKPENEKFGRNRY